MEVSPRGGGNRIAELQRSASKIDLIEAEMLKSLGMPIETICDMELTDYWVNFILHSNRGGQFQRIDYLQEFYERHVVEEAILVKDGDEIKPFTGANQSLGTIFLRFETREQLDQFVSSPQKYISIITQ